MSLPSFHIGPVPVDPGLLLAPMSGVTDSPFRRLVKRCSGDDVGLLVSEFISIEGLTRRALRSQTRMAFHADEGPVAIQIFGSDPELMAEAAQMVEDSGARIVDINCGCPAPRVVKRGGGAGLLQDLPRLQDILEKTVEAVSIPVTVKVRNGWCAESLNALETLKVVEGSGAQSLTIHGRTRVQLYRGDADWDVVRELASRATIPVIGSGDILSSEDARRRLDETGCAGVMIGRGAINNPWIFRQIVDEMSGREAHAPTWREKIDAIAAYRSMLLEFYPTKVAPGRMKMMLSRLIKGIPGASDIRRDCMLSQDPTEMLELLTNHCDRFGILDLDAGKISSRMPPLEADVPVRAQAA
jgi:nifR3 family TIM-barrel protein